MTVTIEVIPTVAVDHPLEMVNKALDDVTNARVQADKTAAEVERMLADAFAAWKRVDPNAPTLDDYNTLLKKRAEDNKTQKSIEASARTILAQMYTCIKDSVFIRGLTSRNKQKADTWVYDEGAALDWARENAVHMLVLNKEALETALPTMPENDRVKFGAKEIKGFKFTLPSKIEERTDEPEANVPAF